MIPPQLETERLLLRPMGMDDAEAVFTLYSNPEVVRYLTDPLMTGIKQAEAFLSSLDTGSDFAFGIALKENGKLIGTCGLGPEESGDWGFGYCLLPAYWSKGYATETLKAVVAFAKGLGIKALYAGHAVENPASGRVMEKNGFHFDHDGSFTKDGGSITYQSKYYRIQLND